MSDNNIPDSNFLNNPSLPSLGILNDSYRFIETNRVLPGLLSFTGYEHKVDPPLLEGEGDSLGADIN